MTALHYALMPECVIIAMDSLSLAAEPDDSKVPYAFCTKVFPLPHLNGVICGTGLMSVLLDWFVMVQGQVVCRDMLFLDTIAPTHLPVIAARYGDDMTSTVYHFGYDESRHRYRGFAYRGTNGYKSEEIPYALGVKPPFPGALAQFEELVAKHGVVEGFVR